MKTIFITKLLKSNLDPLVLIPHLHSIIGSSIDGEGSILELMDERKTMKDMIILQGLTDAISAMEVKWKSKAG